MTEFEMARIMFRFSKPSFIKRLIASFYEAVLYLKSVFGRVAESDVYYYQFLADYMAGVPTCNPCSKSGAPVLCLEAF